MIATGDETELWLRCLRSRVDSEIDLICLPHAGGSATAFRALAGALTAPVDVYSVQYPGRQDRRMEPPITTITELAERVEEVLVMRRRPFALLGHSMGAVVGFVVADRLLERTDRKPVGLILSGRRAPSVHRDERLHLASDTVMIDRLQRLGGTGANFLSEPELWQMIAPSIRADYQAIETYRHPRRPPLAVPLSVLIGKSDPCVTAQEGAAWRDHTAAGFRFRVVDGDHFYLSNPRPALCSAIAADLRWFQSGAA